MAETMLAETRRRDAAMLTCAPGRVHGSTARGVAALVAVSLLCDCLGRSAATRGLGASVPEGCFVGRCGGAGARSCRLDRLRGGGGGSDGAGGEAAGAGGGGDGGASMMDVAGRPEHPSLAETDEVALPSLDSFNVSDETSVLKVKLALAQAEVPPSRTRLRASFRDSEACRCACSVGHMLRRPCR